MFIEGGGGTYNNKTHCVAYNLQFYIDLVDAFRPWAGMLVYPWTANETECTFFLLSRVESYTLWAWQRDAAGRQRNPASCFNYKLIVWFIFLTFVRSFLGTTRRKNAGADWAGTETTKKHTHTHCYTPLEPNQSRRRLKMNWIVAVRVATSL